MLEEIRNIKSGKKEVRQFGITVGIALGLLGGLFFLREKNYYFYFLTLSFTFLFLSLVAPRLLKPVQKIWMGLAFLIGWLITRIILIILFYLVITPIGILAKIFGQDFLDLKLDKNRQTYWIIKSSAKVDKRSYENQF